MEERKKRMGKKGRRAGICWVVLVFYGQNFAGGDSRKGKGKGKIAKVRKMKYFKYISLI